MRLNRSGAGQNGRRHHQYAKHMPNAPRRYKLLLISVLLVAPKFSLSASVPRMGFCCPVLGHVRSAISILTNRAERQTKTVGHGSFDYADDCHFQSRRPPGAQCSALSERMTRPERKPLYLIRKIIVLGQEERLSRLPISLVSLRMFPRIFVESQ